MISQKAQEALQARYYPDLQAVVFGRFETQFAACLKEKAVVLDAGSGPGSWILQAPPYRERLRLLVGEDVYRPTTTQLDAFVLARSEQLPFADRTFDMVVAYQVLEHLPQPIETLREIARVLKPGGYFCFKTPAVHTPLFLLAKLLPVHWHKRLKTHIGADEGDVFPTYYRANTVPALEHDLTGVGLQRVWLRTVDQTYAYLSHTPWSYALGLLYSRATERPALAWLRNQIIGIYRLPGDMS